MHNKLRKRRKFLKLTQEQLACKSNVSRQTISLIENNQLRNIESRIMFKLAYALECDIGDIFYSENIIFTRRKEKKGI